MLGPPATGRNMGCVTEHGGDGHGMPTALGVAKGEGGFFQWSPVLSSLTVVCVECSFSLKF